jgi:hypothetical protein
MISIVELNIENAEHRESQDAGNFGFSVVAHRFQAERQQLTSPVW